jgi:hypothetical protein
LSPLGAIEVFMAEMNPHQANANLWSAYLSRQWEPWLPASSEGRGPATWTGALVAAAFAPWLALVTRPSKGEDR